MNKKNKKNAFKMTEIWRINFFACEKKSELKFDLRRYESCEAQSKIA